jgi:hypothetical protein
VPSSTFSIRPMAQLDSVGIDVAVDDVFFNLVTRDTQLMRGSSPWRGGTKFLVILSFVAFSVLIMTLLLTIFFVS